MLEDITEIKVRFSEIDSMGILWHGHYIKYFEDGRESFGKAYGLGYLDVYDQYGFLIPLVKIDCNYKKPIRYLDRVMLKITYIDSPAAKLIFDYSLYNPDSNEVYATGRSQQVFLSKNHELQLTIPDFFATWKVQYKIQAH